MVKNLGSPGSSAGRESTCNAGDTSLIPGSGRSAGEGIGYRLQYSGLKNSMDCMVHGVAKSWTWLSNFYFHFHFILVVKNLPANSGDVISREQVWSLGGKIPWRRAWQLTPVFSPGESHGHRSLVGYLMDIGLQSVGHTWLKQLSMHVHRHIQVLIFFLFIAFSSLQS